MVKKFKFGSNKIVGAFGPSLGLAGMSAGASIIGGGFEKVPGGAGNALSSVGSETAKYVAPAAAIGFMGFATKGIGKFNNTKKRRRR
jgi:hypothetical protein